MENDRLIFDGAFFDITERKRAEVDLVKKNEELNASYEQIAAAEEELRGNIDELTRQEKALIDSERETRESRDIMRAYLDHSYDAVFIHDNAGKVLDVNATTLRLYRVTREEALGYTIADYTGPAYAMDNAQEHWDRVLAGEDRFFPWQARRPHDGSVFDVEVYLTPITIDGRQIILANIRDITERKRAEEEIRKKNEELHAANEQLAAAEEELKGQFDALAESEQMIRESEERVRNKLESLLSPEGHIGNLDLADIIDVEEIQSMMDDFHALTHIGIAILDINGKILVATGWQDICTKFHRVNPETCANCAESDTFLASGVEPGTVKRYRCKNNMWDLVTPIVIGGSHVGNLFLGQFLFEDESVNDELFRSQAVRYGFDEQPYLAALERVPRWNRETVDTVMAFYAKFARMVSTLSHSNITLVRTVTERDTTLNSLLKVNQKLNVLSQLTRQDLTTQIFIVNSFLEMAKKQAKGQDGIIKNIESGERAVRSIKEITEFTKDYQNMGEKPPKWQNVKLAFLFGLSHISIGEIRHSLETENLEISADSLLEKAFQGLLENSVAHGGHVSKIRVSHTVTPDWVTIVFEDNGIGISAEKKERIFLRGEGARASVRGLFFVQEILSITGIIIRENGEPGKGTRFEMTVPKGAWRMKGTGD
jgi:PAS domain S-box-containing protein